MTTLAHPPLAHDLEHLRGRVGMLLFIMFEAIFFCTFVLAYLYYVGKSATGPQPAQVLGLGLVVVNTICLLSSSGTIIVAERCLRAGRVGALRLWLAATVALGVEFIAGTAVEWHGLIFRDGLTISTNLFGTTYYSLVGFHAAHVIVGLTLLTAILLLAAGGRIRQAHAERVGVISLYWHFVDGVWVVVFTSVYIIGR
jgi:cytochrome c oxidase subunit III